ncbi:unnamed protein product [Ostreobium quekettii]|uniref:Uncharacterized protein n=1 Tax=Ostreobium quekettii TaxID=121088 RepID=A0A8S1ISS8_9CHLO|nr:unnamed protein product [Ostreobium quekettii]|eukprot:evm.model.scf_1698EXC.1 EVM.evm.TU.scf_1698EXC.1   scf_1698EXC:8306-16779(+)
MLRIAFLVTRECHLRRALGKMSQQLRHAAATRDPLPDVDSAVAAFPGPPEFPQAATAARFPEAAHDVMGFDDLLPEDARAVRRRVREFMAAEVAPKIAGYWERAEFPFEVLPELKKLNIGGLSVKYPGCSGLSTLGTGMVMAEMARVDASLSTFVMVHASLAMHTIELMGTEEQKQELLPKLSGLDLVGCWGLTEPDHGSDAAKLSTTARAVEGGWVLNGRKRWIGNGTFADVAVIWATNADNGEINAFIVRKGTPGFRTTKIENKISLRCVQNANIHMEDVFVSEAARLPGVTSARDTAKVLSTSRITVAWQPVGIAMGAYDVCMRYVGQREQFGSPLAAFQLVQEKLSRMLANIQAMTLMTWRLSELCDSGRSTTGMASLVKSWNTLRCRETVALARELLGGNGILSEFHVAKAFCDIEAIYTYEGTYDINSLVTARETTGISAIRAPKK